jgi:hypothetical protein
MLSSMLKPQNQWYAVFRTLLVIADKDARLDEVALCRWAQNLDLQMRPGTPNIRVGDRGGRSGENH